MPKSKHRKNHKSKVKKRNTKNKDLVKQFLNIQTKSREERKAENIKNAEIITRQSMGDEFVDSGSVLKTKEEVMVETWANHVNPLDQIANINDFK